MKMSPCCARPVAVLTRAEAELAALARTVAYRDSKGRDITKLTATLQERKAVVAAAKQAVADHEAGHAGEAVSA